MKKENQIDIKQLVVKPAQEGGENNSNLKSNVQAVRWVLVYNYESRGQNQDCNR